MSLTGTQPPQSPATGAMPQPATAAGRALAGLADRLPFAKQWDARHSWVLLGILCAATLGVLLNHQGQAFPLLLVACACFVLLLVMEARRSLLGSKVVIWASVALIVVAVLAPPRESEDVWSYAMYGHMVANLHADPYKVSPLTYSGDPWFWRVSVWWHDTRTVYGPVFTAASAVGMRLAGDSALRARLFFQGLTGASVILALLVLYRRRVESSALVFLGLSPLTVVSVVNGAHNDAIVGLAALGAVVALGRRWRVLAGVALGLAALVKLIALLPGAAVFIWAWRRQGRAAALKMGAAMGVVAGAGYLFVGGLAALAPLQEASRLVDNFSLWGPFGQPKPVSPAGQGPLGGLLISPVHQQWLTGPVRLASLALVVCLVGLVMIAGSSETRPSAGAGAVVLAFVLATSYVQPWYLAAVLPLVALQWRSRLAFLATGYSILLLLANEWLSTGGWVKAVLRVPLSTAFPVYQLLALVALVAIAISQLRKEPLSSAIIKLRQQV